MFVRIIQNLKKYIYFKKKHEIFLLLTVSVITNLKKIFKVEESVEISNFLV